VARDDNSDSQSDSSELSDEDSEAVRAASDVDQSESATTKELSGKSPEEVVTIPVDGTLDTELQPSGAFPKPSFTTTADTDVMMNGLKLSDDPQAGDGIEFAQHGSQATTLENPVNTSAPTRRLPSVSSGGDSIQARQRMMGSAMSAQAPNGAPFVPNRGGFFMHEHRNEQPRSVAAIRGRGRGKATLSPINPGSRYGLSVFAKRVLY